MRGVMRGVFVVVFCGWQILSTSFADAFGNVNSPHSRMLNKNGRTGICGHRRVLPVCNQNKNKRVGRSRFTSAASTTTQLGLRWLDKSELADQEFAIQLNPEQDQALRQAAEELSNDFGTDWFENPEAWEKLSSSYPDLVVEYSTDELRRAYLKQTPQMMDILTKTPLGPFILVNLIFLATGFSWCNTPFHQDGACPPM